MYKIHLKGPKKAVYLVRNNLVGYGLPYILFETGTDDLYVMHCEMATKHDGIPNQHCWFDDPQEKWDGNTVDLSVINFDDIIAGKYNLDYIDYELDVLSGLFNVDIEILNDPDDKWWEDADCDPQYPFYAYSKGKEVKNVVRESDDPEIFSF